MLVEALKLYGVTEKAGDTDNPVIMDWAKELGFKDYTADSIPWCGLFMAYVAHKADKDAPKTPLWARNWGSFGSPCEPELGCVLVFARGHAGHVGIYVGEDDTHFHVYGGNQGDMVCITRIPRERLVASRAFYNKKPANIRKVILKPVGEVSSSEQ